MNPHASPEEKILEALGSREWTREEIARKTSLSERELKDRLYQMAHAGSVKSDRIGFGNTTMTIYRRASQ